MKRGFTLIELLVLLTIIGVLLAIVIASFEKGDTSNASDNNQSTEVGADIPPATARAVDTANVLSHDDLKVLNATLENTPKEIGVLFVNTTGGLSIEEYGIRAAEKWRVGDDLADDGVMLIVAVQDRKIRIEVGRGAEASLTDGEADHIIREFIGPKFKEGRWLEGAIGGVNAIVAEVQ